MIICVKSYNLRNSKCEKSLGIKINHKPNFNTHIDQICKKTGQK